jgi:hypothetical protein
MTGFLKMSGVDRLHLSDGRTVAWRDVRLTWNQWVATWERDREGKNVGEILPGTVTPLFPLLAQEILPAANSDHPAEKNHASEKH